MRKSSPQRAPDDTDDVTSDVAVNSEPCAHSGTPEPALLPPLEQRQMDELDRHRQMVQKMSDKVIDLHTKVCDNIRKCRL